VLVVDDQELFRAVLRDVVSPTPDMTLVGEAASGEALVDAVEKLSPQLVVMDKRMPGIGGIEAAQRIRARRPEIVRGARLGRSSRSRAAERERCCRVPAQASALAARLAELWQTYGA
jgi:DNA-binding NarL/FixJ family response regulator